MKSIGYVDRADGRRVLMVFKEPEGLQPELDRQKRIDRIKEALQELKHVGNISVYLVKGNKSRLLFTKGI